MATPKSTDPARPPVLYLAGPTASGKSAVALEIARLVPTEIISVDSALVYRGMDIGTAKPTAAERAAVPHHLIDIRDPRDAYSAAEFERDARRLIDEIRARGKLPLLVGGTMLYFKALFEGLDPLPPANAEVRRQIEAHAASEGWPVLHAELARVDPVTAARLAPADSQRIQRALEVWHITGQPLSTLQTIRNVATRSDAQSARAFFCLEPSDRAWLHDRIALRFDQMLADGLVDEVAALRARGDLSPDLPSMRCVGYRQVWDTLDGRQPLHTLRERGIAATRQLAKRQLTWLRSMPWRRIVPISDKNRPDELARQVLTMSGADNF